MGHGWYLGFTVYQCLPGTYGIIRYTTFSWELHWVYYLCPTPFLPKTSKDYSQTSKGEDVASLEGDRTFLVLLFCLPTKDSLQHSSVFNQAFPRVSTFHDNLLLLLWNASCCGSETFWSCPVTPVTPIDGPIPTVRRPAQWPRRTSAAGFLVYSPPMGTPRWISRPSAAFGHKISSLADQNFRHESHQKLGHTQFSNIPTCKTCWTPMAAAALPIWWLGL